MSLNNPYDPPEAIPEPKPVAEARNTDLLWFTATVALVVASAIVLINASRWGIPFASEVFFRSLIATSASTIAAVVIYGTVSQFAGPTCSSTPRSQILVGLVAAGYVIAVHLIWQYSPGGSVYLILPVLIAVPLCYPLARVEHWIAAGKPDRDIGLAATGATPKQANILWFAAACSAILTVLGAATQPDPWSPLAWLGGLTMGGSMSLIAVAVYGAASLCVRRSAPATRASRIAAAAGFVALSWCIGLLMNAFGLPPGMWRLVAFLVSAAPAVWIDRRVSGLDIGC